jgi:hypothetical protein
VGIIPYMGALFIIFVIGIRFAELDVLLTIAWVNITTSWIVTYDHWKSGWRKVK